MLNNTFDTKIICSSSNNPWYNLSLEEYLFTKVNKNQIILYLWQNDNTIVLGRNQNPWKECKCKSFEKDNGKIARRLSGGGAVFHDLGNLNFTFIMDKNLHNLNTQLKVILNAVISLGIKCEFSGRNDILANNKKFSGNAFYEDDYSYYHHGTILINSNMNKLTKYLKVSKEKISSKGIDSISSRVINLQDINHNISVDSMKKNLINSFIEIYGGTPLIEYINEKILPLEDLYKKYSSWEWIYGETPRFDINFVNRFIWGEIDLNLKLNNGLIDSAVIYSDAIDSKLIKNIASNLSNLPFKIVEIEKKLNSIKDEKNIKIIDDIINFLKTKLSF
ncbi:lipoate--protein ligase [Clostridium sp. MB40-C1]|uniref:lipoate--protein ligase n=1 Tax=Clostridium sp. MB40-C1 TaxID=3070996 RepID=UPI0027E19C1E|nr:lipoate--protein ligase [Clostridium sp. MB40-C1]WMJ79653.1 lipoate--protein ligase [Clostridium sp. MB40-C1]